jgi:hypothetical protein
MAIGGNWPGYPDATTPFPSSMFVDYVRVYQPATPSDVASVDASVIEVYPNPATNELTIEGTLQGGECSILDATGKCVQIVSCSDINTRIDLSALAVGNYTLEYTAGGQRITRSFVKH